MHGSGLKPHMDPKRLADMLATRGSVDVQPEEILHAGDAAHKQGIHPGFETQGIDIARS